jgi:hypothetical protein
MDMEWERLVQNWGACSYTWERHVIWQEQWEDQGYCVEEYYCRLGC